MIPKFKNGNRKVTKGRKHSTMFVHRHSLVSRELLRTALLKFRTTPQTIENKKGEIVENPEWRALVDKHHSSIAVSKKLRQVDTKTI